MAQFHFSFSSFLRPNLEIFVAHMIQKNYDFISIHQAKETPSQHFIINIL